MSNPVFDRIDKDIDRRYAGFGSGPAPQQPQYGQQASPYPQSPAYGQHSPQGQMSREQMEARYQAPSAGPVDMGRLTVDDVIMKALGLFALAMIFAAGTWFLTAPAPASAGVLLLGGIVGTLVLGLVIAFKKTISVPLIVTYAALEGVLLGAVSMVFEYRWPGIVMTAVVATLSVFVGMFAGWKVGFVRVTDRSRRIFTLAIFGYAIFALVNLVAAWAFGMNGGWGFFGRGSMLSILVSVFAVGLASYSLAMDFDSIDKAVAAQVPQKYSWLLAHGLIVTLVWLYLELLRLFAQFRE